MGKTAQILCTAFYCGPTPALTPNAPPKWKGCTNKHQSKTWTDARSVNINAPYEQFIGVLAFSNSANTWKHSGLTYLKAFLSLHTLQACGSLETDRPQDQHPCSTPCDQPDGEQTSSWVHFTKFSFPFEKVINYYIPMLRLRMMHYTFFLKSHFKLKNTI